MQRKDIPVTDVNNNSQYQSLNSNSSYQIPQSGTLGNSSTGPSSTYQSVSQMISNLTIANHQNTNANLNNNQTTNNIASYQSLENKPQISYTPFTSTTHPEHIVQLIQNLQKRIFDFLHINHDQLKFKMLNEGLELINSINSAGENDAQLLDLYMTINSVYRICSRHNNILPRIKGFLETREDILIGDTNDYCYHETLANNFCYHLATLLFPQQPAMNVLLRKALTENRSTPWQDVTTLENDIPSPGSFFRTNDNCIHLYAPVVDRAIANLNRGQAKLSEIWFGTDEKNLRTLSQEELNILKQRSQTLKNLVTYTEELENYRGALSKRFDDLRNGLIAGSNGGGEAKSPAYTGVAQFFNWWNELDNSEAGRIEKDKILKIAGMNQYLDYLSKVKDACVTGLHNQLSQVYDVPNVREALRVIEKDDAHYLSSDELDKLRKQITQELEEYQNINVNKNIFEDISRSPQFIEKLKGRGEKLTYGDVKVAIIEMKTNLTTPQTTNIQQTVTPNSKMPGSFYNDPNNGMYNQRHPIPIVKHGLFKHLRQRHEEKKYEKQMLKQHGMF